MPHLNKEIPEAAIEGSEFLPGFVPDPLWPESTALVGPRETTSFWITIEAGAFATAGEYPLIVTCWTADNETVSMTLTHGSDTTYIPLFGPPLDGVERPTQLPGAERAGEDYTFEGSQVERWLAVAREVGMRHFEWTHLFTPWGAEYTIRIYHGWGEDNAPQCQIVNRTALWPVFRTVYRAPSFSAQGFNPRKLGSCSSERPRSTSR